jgi:hypothetical protein
VPNLAARACLHRTEVIGVDTFADQQRVRRRTAASTILPNRAATASSWPIRATASCRRKLLRLFRAQKPAGLIRPHQPDRGIARGAGSMDCPVARSWRSETSGRHDGGLFALRRYSAAISHILEHGASDFSAHAWIHGYSGASKVTATP